MIEAQGFKRETAPCIEWGVHRAFICMLQCSSDNTLAHCGAFKHLIGASLSKSHMYKKYSEGVCIYIYMLYICI